jgi:anti-anti-sigma factor
MLACVAFAVYTATDDAMELPHVVRGKVLVCSPEGDVDEATVHLIAELAASPHAGWSHALILDMGAATYISSQGVASLLKLQTDLALQKRHISLASPSPLVKRILYQAGVASAMAIHATVEAACAEAEKPFRA